MPGEKYEGNSVNIGEPLLGENAMIGAVVYQNLAGRSVKEGLGRED